jgi:hypothetical protein
MWTRPLCVAALVASAALVYGCQDGVAGSPSTASDAHATPDVTASQDAGADATATVDAAAIVECGAIDSGPDAAACKIPAAASSGEAGASCQPGTWELPGPPPCGSYFYVMNCDPRATPDSSMGCFGVGYGLDGGTSYCCPCEGVSTCVNVDLSTYDRSCRSDSDCVAVFGGTSCAGTCDCGPNAAINVAGQCRYQSSYQQAFATVPPVSFECNGCPPDAPRALCIEGVCMYCPRGALGDLDGCSP